MTLPRFRHLFFVLCGSSALIAAAGTARAAEGETPPAGLLEVHVAAWGGADRPAWRAHLWVPERLDRVRGLVVVGDGGLPATLRPDLRAFARHFGFALLGLDGLRHCEPAYLSEVFATLAARSGRPEIARAPFVAMGNSNGGMLAQLLACRWPERAIALACHVGAIGDFEDPELRQAYPAWVGYAPPTALDEVPAIFGLGEWEMEILARQVRMLVTRGRARGARWALAVEERLGHTARDGRLAGLYLPFLAEMITRRYPRPGPGPEETVRLRSLPEAEGWLVDTGALASESPAATIMSTPRAVAEAWPWAEYPGERARAAASWLPSEAMARLFQAATARGQPLKLMPAAGRANDTAERPLAVIAPHEAFRMHAETFATTWRRLALRSVGEGAAERVASGEPRRRAGLDFAPTPAAGVRAFFVEGERDEAPRTAISRPLAVMVEGGPGTVHPLESGAPWLRVPPPARVHVAEGECLRIVAYAEGAGASYEWSRDGAILADARTNVLLRPDAAAATHAGRYVLRVRNAHGVTESAPVEVVVTEFTGIDAVATEAEAAPGAATPATRTLVRSGTGDSAATAGPAPTLALSWDARFLHLRLDHVSTNDARDAVAEEVELEVFLGGANTRGPTYGANDHHFVFALGEREHGDHGARNELAEQPRVHARRGLAPAGSEVRRAGADAWVISLPLYLAGRPLRTGERLGFNVALRLGSARRWVLFSDDDLSWLSPAAWGVARLR